MKKFISMFCALAIVLSVNAVPQTKALQNVKTIKVEKTVKAGKQLPAQAKAAKATATPTFKQAFAQKDQKVTASKKQVVSLKNDAAKQQLAAKKQAKKVAAPKASKAIANDAALAARKNHAAKAPQAKKETVVLSFDSEDAEFDWRDYVAEEGWWQLQAEDEDFYLSLSNLTPVEAVAGEYDWADMDESYSFLYSSEAEGYVLFESGSIKLETPEVEGFALIITGALVGNDSNTYELNINYVEESVAGEYEFVATVETHSYFASDNDVYYKLADASGNTAYFDIVLGDTTLNDVELGKEYTLDNMLAQYSSITYEGKDADFVEATFKKTVDEGVEHIAAEVTDELGRIFHISYEFTAPKAEKFDTITAPVELASEPYWFWTLYTFTAQDEKNAIALELLPDDSYFGEWIAGDEIEGSVLEIASETASEIYSGTVVIAPNAEGFSITGKVLCLNNTEYTLNLTYKTPDATRADTLKIEGLELAVLDGAWQVAGFSADEKNYVSIAAYADSVAGDYTEADLAEQYCYIWTGLVLDEEGYVEEGSQFKMLKANLHIDFNKADSTIAVRGEFLGQNADSLAEVVAFHLDLSGRIPAPEVSNLTFEFSEDEDGITVTPSNDEDAWDWYVADSATIAEYGSAQAFAEAVYDYFGNAYAVTGEQLLAWEDVNYYCEADGTYYLLVWGAGERNMTTDAFTHEFEYESGVPEGCTQYDAEEGNDFIVDFAEFEIDDRYLEQYGVILVDALTEKGEYISLQLLLPEGATELVAGEYPVLADGEGPLTFAGELDLTEGSIYGSFAGFLTESGSISVPLWCLVGGKVILNADGTIDVDAVNCAGAKIQCHLGEPEGPAEDVKISFIDQNEQLLDSQIVTLALPAAPEIEGFVFLGWQVVASESLISEEGIFLQAVYKAEDQAAPEVVANPANAAQKLIRNGNVYILRDERTYTLKGQLVK